MVKYLHLVDGRPGQFDGTQICIGSRGPFPLLPSLKDIRREQRASRLYRESQGWDVPHYSHVRVEA